MKISKNSFAFLELALLNNSMRQFSLKMKQI